MDDTRRDQVEMYKGTLFRCSEFSQGLVLGRLHKEEEQHVLKPVILAVSLAQIRI